MKPYDQQPGESTKNYTAFRCYLDAGPQRSVRMVSRKLAKCKALISRWSSAWQWVSRVRAWEADDARRRQQAEEELALRDARKWAVRQQRVRDDEYDLGQAMLARAREMLAFPLTRKIVREEGRTIIIEPARWQASDVSRMADVAAELVRRSSGLATSRLELGGVDGQPVVAGRVMIVVPANGRDAGQSGEGEKK